jgi:hypothetical protein
MNFDIWQSVVSGLASSGILILAIYAAIRLAGKTFKGILEEQLKQATQHFYNSALENQRSVLARESERLRSWLSTDQQLLGILSSGYTTSQNVRLEAFRMLWECVLDIREYTAVPLHHYSLLLREEYADKPVASLGNGSIGNALSVLAKDSSRNPSDTVMKGSEKMRPFVGEKLWLGYWAYRAFLLGLDAHVLKTVSETGCIPTLDYFQATRQSMLELVLNKEEIDAQFLRPFGAPFGIATLLEDYMLQEMNRWIFGHGVVDLSVEQRTEFIRNEARQV